MRIAMLFAALCVLPALVLAKGPTTRIEVGHGKRAIVVLTGPESAGQFTIWNGPGTSSTGEGDFADWAAGPVDEPERVAIYSARFYCAANAPGYESIPSNQCYGVRYAVGADGRGYIQIPPAVDAEFPLSGQSIMRGVEGNWYRATARWDETIRPRLEAAYASTRQDDNRRIYRQPTRVHRQPSSSTRATRATPRITPKH